jgi:predicted NodU family carbamoyl transferase
LFSIPEPACFVCSLVLGQTSPTASALAEFSVFSEDTKVEVTADALAQQQAVGWFQGRMEFGPRALGARSILGDPRSPTMQHAI